MCCDLFAVATVGPAYGWAHFHLCIERGGDPFETPMALSSSHPADAARMKAVLHMLSILGFEDEVKKMAEAWQQFEDMTGATASPEYRQCYADTLLKQLVTGAHAGIAKVGVIVATPAGMKGTVSLLNDAWARFWREPAGYAGWESAGIDALRTTLGSSRP